MATGEFSYDARIQALRATKERHTLEKREQIGAMDYDDHGLILPPPDSRRFVEVMGASGVPVTDVLLREFDPVSNHPSGGFFGPRACGENFRRLLEIHPVYIDPMSSLAGAYMMNFMSCRHPAWHPDFDYTHLSEEQETYKLQHGIGAVQHFCQDLRIGFDLGWGGILKKIHRYRKINTDDEARDLYDGMEAVVLGFQNWVSRHADAARRMAEVEAHRQLRRNLMEISDINRWLATNPPRTFREACQWMLWYQMAGKMYNNSGSLGRIDLLLYPFYERDMAAGRLTDDEAVFHIACHLVHDTSYCQLGGPDETGRDVTNPVSFLVLEAAHRLGVPANIGVCVGRDVGATPNGRHARAPISHGANPDPGFCRDGAPSALALAVASVQPGYGNAAPLQMDVDPGMGRTDEGATKMASLIRTHFDLGGTQINMNVVDKAQILKAHRNPEAYPNLIVRVTGFSAYFASLSPEFRQLVVDRIVSES